MIEVEDELAVSGLALPLLFECILSASLELSILPRSAFILSEILNGEWFYSGDGEQSLPSRMKGEASEVTGNPSSIELLRYSGSTPASDETIQHEVALV